MEERPLIQHKVIDGLLLRDMLIAGANLLEQNREAVDALNVFPVPDGDTGTNMSLTMQSAVREINAQEYLRADEAAAAVSKGALKGARGNSGVITSQLLRGFATALKGVDKIYADKELKACNDWIAGANKTDKHVRHLSLIRDVELPIEYVDLRNAVAGDPCPACGKPLEIKRGIEVGHIFKLGTKYSEALRATFLDENGKERIIVMGCYGIGVSRVVAACIEQNFDNDGIKFPPQLAPFDAQIVCLDPKDAEVAGKCDMIEAFLEGMGLECLYDDREERPGVKFKDADLIGLPVQITVGGKGLKNGVIEVKNRRTGEKSTIDADKFEMIFPSWYDSVLESWKR